MSCENSDISRVFDHLTSRWRHETRFSSSAHDIVEHPDYQRIAALGPCVIPLIHADMRRGELWWDYALQSITGQNPAVGTQSPSEATSAWLRWLDG